MAKEDDVGRFFSEPIGPTDHFRDADMPALGTSTQESKTSGSMAESDRLVNTVLALRKNRFSWINTNPKRGAPDPYAWKVWAQMGTILDVSVKGAMKAGGKDFGKGDENDSMDTTSALQGTLEATAVIDYISTFEQCPELIAYDRNLKITDLLTGSSECDRENDRIFLSISEHGTRSFAALMMATFVEVIAKIVREDEERPKYEIVDAVSGSDENGAIHEYTVPHDSYPVDPYLGDFNHFFDHATKVLLAAIKKFGPSKKKYDKAWSDDNRSEVVKKFQIFWQFLTQEGKAFDEASHGEWQYHGPGYLAQQPKGASIKRADYPNIFYETEFARRKVKNILEHLVYAGEALSVMVQMKSDHKSGAEHAAATLQGAVKIGMSASGAALPPGTAAVVNGVVGKVVEYGAGSLKVDQKSISAMKALKKTVFNILLQGTQSSSGEPLMPCMGSSRDMKDMAGGTMGIALPSDPPLKSLDEQIETSLNGCADPAFCRNINDALLEPSIPCMSVQKVLSKMNTAFLLTNYARQCKPLPEKTTRLPAAEICEKDTEGTCSVLGCDGWRNAKCNDDTDKCMCPSGTCRKKITGHDDGYGCVMHSEEFMVNEDDFGRRERIVTFPSDALVLPEPCDRIIVANAGFFETKTKTSRPEPNEEVEENGGPMPEGQCWGCGTLDDWSGRWAGKCFVACRSGVNECKRPYYDKLSIEVAFAKDVKGDELSCKTHKDCADAMPKGCTKTRWNNGECWSVGIFDKITGCRARPHPNPRKNAPDEELDSKTPADAISGPVAVERPEVTFAKEVRMAIMRYRELQTLLTEKKKVPEDVLGPIISDVTSIGVAVGGLDWGADDFSPADGIKKITGAMDDMKTAQMISVATVSAATQAIHTASTTDVEGMSDEEKEAHVAKVSKTLLDTV